DRLIVGGKPSARLDIGQGASLACRYGEAVFRARAAGETAVGRGEPLAELVVRRVNGRPSAARLKELAGGEMKAAFDADAVSMPFSVRRLRAGDRIRPFGAAAHKKVKEILIDRKIPREERWGRPVVCDGGGEIVWIPGVVRSSAAPVTRETRRTVVLGLS
ncbi:MAG: tRNA lysidine(34) synthetase TilS, partial [Gemmatimonadota bacterium]